MEILREVREMTWEWTKTNGPVSGWPALFLADLKDASRNRKIEEFRSDWRSHSGVGKALVRMLRDIAASKLPNDPAALRDVFRQALDLATTLLTGIGIIDAHLAALDS